jgi:hypothetical protein
MIFCKSSTMMRRRIPEHERLLVTFLLVLVLLYFF